MMQSAGSTAAWCLREARTLWETEQGSDAFDQAGSLCHAWSAAPLWYSQAYLLGVEPLEPVIGSEFGHMQLDCRRPAELCPRRTG